MWHVGSAPAVRQRRALAVALRLQAARSADARGRFEFVSVCRGAIFPATGTLGLPLPLAGEGWGGGLSAMGLPMVDPEHPDWKVSPQLRANARALRRNSTDAERILWSQLRANRLNGTSFRRQAPIETYVADFVCHAAKLVIEIDGGQHFSDEGERA